jgi:hypothetical protein
MIGGDQILTSVSTAKHTANPTINDTVSKLLLMPKH